MVVARRDRMRCVSTYCHVSNLPLWGIWVDESSTWVAASLVYGSEAMAWDAVQARREQGEA